MNATLQYIQGMSMLYGNATNIPGFVLKHGQSFDNIGIAPKRGQIKECFVNSFNLMKLNPSLTYCEGYALGAVVPVLHAWCVNDRNEVIDITWKPGHGQFYYGIKFKREFVIRYLTSKRDNSIIDDMENNFAIVTGKIPVEHWKA